MILLGEMRPHKRRDFSMSRACYLLLGWFATWSLLCWAWQRWVG